MCVRNRTKGEKLEGSCCVKIKREGHKWWAKALRACVKGDKWVGVVSVQRTKRADGRRRRGRVEFPCVRGTNYPGVHGVGW